jgi:hypothetical protein
MAVEAEGMAAEAEVMAAEAEVMAAAVILAAVDTSAVAGISAVAGTSVAGMQYRGLPRGPVSALTVRLRSTAVRTGPPAAGQR